MPSTPDEFSFLAGDAARVGVSPPLPRVTRERASTTEGTVSALRFSDEPPQVSFLHGAGLNAHTFDPTILALGLPALSLDLPGHGRSEWRTDGDYSPQSIAPATASALQELSGPGQVLVGHSLGGLTAAQVLHRHRHLARHLIIVDITPGVVPTDGGARITEFITGVPHFQTLEEIVDRAIEFGIGHDRAALLRGVTLNTRQRDDGRFEFAHHLAHLTRESSPATPAPAKPPLSAGWPALEELGAAGLPITLVQGTEGMVSSKLAQEWAARVPGGEVVTVTAGHNVQEHAPRELAAIVRERA